MSGYSKYLHVQETVNSCKFTSKIDHQKCCIFAHFAFAFHYQILSAGTTSDLWELGCKVLGDCHSSWTVSFHHRLGPCAVSVQQLMNFIPDLCLDASGNLQILLKWVQTWWITNQRLLCIEISTGLDPIGSHDQLHLALLLLYFEVTLISDIRPIWIHGERSLVRCICQPPAPWKKNLRQGRNIQQKSSWP